MIYVLLHTCAPDSNMFFFLVISLLEIAKIVKVIQNLGNWLLLQEVG